MLAYELTLYLQSCVAAFSDLHPALDSNLDAAPRRSVLYLSPPVIRNRLGLSVRITFEP